MEVLMRGICEQWGGMTWYCGFEKNLKACCWWRWKEGKALVHWVVKFCVFGLRIEDMEYRWERFDGQGL